MESLAAFNLDDLEPRQVHALVAVAVAVGTLYCFLGYRTLKFVIALTGFLLAGATATVLAGWATEGHLISMAVAGFIGGLCGAMALFFLYKTGIFFIGLLGAAIVAHEALGPRPEAWIPIAVVGIGLAGGFVALFIERPVIMLATAAIGAWMVVSGVVFFLYGPDGFMSEGGAAAIEEYEFRIAGSWAALGLCGSVTQWITRPKNTPSKN